MELSQSQVTTLLASLESEPVEAVWLYGSYANGSAHAGSDLDVALQLVSGVDEWSFLAGINSQLSNRLGLQVNAININSAPTPLALEAVEGRRLWASSQALAMLTEQGIWGKWQEWQENRK